MTTARSFAAAGRPSPDEIRRAFSSFARQHGVIEPRGGFVFDDKLHRCDVIVNGRVRSGDGAYRLFDSDVPAGWLQNWCNGNGVQAWCFFKTLTPEQKAKLAESAEAATKQFEADDAARHKEAALKARSQIEKTAPASETHPYLAKKGAKPHGVYVDIHGYLLVPMMDTDGVVHSLQRISPTGEKRFLSGGRKRGLSFTIGAIEPDGEIYMGEGFATMACVHEAMKKGAVVAFDCGNLLPVAKALRAKYTSAKFVFCADDDAWTDGNPGRTKAEEAAKSVGGIVALPMFADPRKIGATDFNDLACAEGLEAVRRCIEAAAAPAAAPTPVDFEVEVERLAKLKPLEYDLERVAEATRLGVRVTTLDDEVKKRRARYAAANTSSQSVVGAKIEPWPEPVDGGELLLALIVVLRTYVILPEHAYLPVALWILHAHAHDAAAISPILAIISPEKRCGKTTLLILVQELTPNALLAANITAAAVFRAIEAWGLTLLVDEADTFLAEREEPRGVINSGHNRRTANIIRVVEEKGEQVPKRFSTWAPKAIAQIRDLPDTLQDRSIAIRLRRKLPGEKVARLRADRTQHLTEINRRAARWAQDNLNALREMDAETPPQLHDRAADNWRTLLIIAECIGGEWPEKTRSAALALEGVDAEAEGETEPSDAVRLLADCKIVFEDRDASELSARDIIADLCGHDEKSLVRLPRWQSHHRQSLCGAAPALRHHVDNTHGRSKQGQEVLAQGPLPRRLEEVPFKEQPKIR